MQKELHSAITGHVRSTGVVPDSSRNLSECLIIQGYMQGSHIAGYVISVEHQLEVTALFDPELLC